MIATGPTRGYTASVDDSAFALRRVPAGTYEIRAQAPGEVAVASVEVRAGATTKLDLTSSGRAAVKGRVVSFRTGEPVRRSKCLARAIRTDANGRRAVFQSDEMSSDARGRFSIPVPAGWETTISCDGWNRDLRTVTSATVTVPDGAVREVELVAVIRRHSWPLPRSGIRLRPGRGGASVEIADLDDRTAAVSSGLEFGDRIDEVDGRSVAGLSSKAVDMLIRDREEGEPARLRVTRRGRALEIEVELGPPGD